jgi:ubiquinone biosynthesis protein
MDWVKLVYAPLAARALRRTLVGRVRDRTASTRGRFTRAEATSLLHAAWRRYDAAVPELPLQPTLGSTMNVRLACFTFSFFQELLAAGVERAYAIELVADATWAVYRLWARIASTAARLTPGKSAALAFAVQGKEHGSLSLRFPFNAPGYAIEEVPAAPGVAFDVVRCPVAAYFREQGAADLCLASWCDLDYPLAELTHQELTRSKTLVQGDKHCDFRVTPEEPRSHAGPARSHLPIYTG